VYGPHHHPALDTPMNPPPHHPTAVVRLLRDIELETWRSPSPPGLPPGNHEGRSLEATSLITGLVSRHSFSASPRQVLCMYHHIYHKPRGPPPLCTYMNRSRWNFVFTPAHPPRSCTLTISPHRPNTHTIGHPLACYIKKNSGRKIEKVVWAYGGGGE
jgi:hypothetical protein